MSHHNEEQQKYQLLDADESVVLLDYAERTTNFAENSDHQPTIPSGEMIDGKNTLQSFDTMSHHTPGSPPVLPVTEEKTQVPPATNQPTLPNGEVIDGKNTLWYFDTAAHGNQQGAPGVDKVWYTDESSATLPHIPATVEPTTVVAVAVDTVPNIVHAELVPELVSSINVAMMDSSADDGAPLASWNKRRFTCVILAVLAAIAAAGLGLYFGFAGDTGNSSNQTEMGPSSSPTNSPSDIMSVDPNITIRDDALTSYINQVTLSNLSITSNGTSPESMALRWMIFNDTTLDTMELTTLDSEEGPFSPIALSIRQRFALLVMWFQQTETEKWAITNFWLVDPNECSWYGIMCEVGSDLGTVGYQNVVTKISIGLLGGYVGVLPPDIGLLSNLNHFEIKTTSDFDPGSNARSLQGSLPDSIGLWTDLTHFDVSSNGLTGPLPDSIGQWTALTYFDVAENYGLTGTLPTGIGQWTELTMFSVTYNGFTGVLPHSIGNWTALTYFDISVTNITGFLPDSIGQWTALEVFGAGETALTGTLPESIGQWTKLYEIFVIENRFSGTIPSSVGNWSLMKSALFNDNQLNGTIPASIGNWSLIEEAYFHRNQFTGSMPSIICQYINPDAGDSLEADCVEVNCTCCTCCEGNGSECF